MAISPEQTDETTRLQSDVVRAFGIDPGHVPQWGGLDVIHEGGTTRVEIQAIVFADDWTEEQRQAVAALVAHAREQA